MSEDPTHIEESLENEMNRLSLQVDDKTRFQLEFASRVTGLSIASFIKQTIKNAVNEISLSKIIHTEECIEEDWSSEIKLTKDWSSYWDNEESVRMVHLLTCQLMKQHITGRDEQVSSFILTHWNYFGIDEKLEGVSAIHCKLIWPHINYLANKWIENKLLDPDCGKKMLDNIFDGTDLELFEAEVKDT